MTIYTHRLEFSSVDTSVPVYIVPPTGEESASMTDPAVTVMTDLRRFRAITIAPSENIVFALELMKYAGVRLLVVVNTENSLLGLISARDIMGEKPMSIMARDKIQRNDVQVRQVMTPRSEIDPFTMADIERATVQDVVIKLREVRRQHALVIEPDDDGRGYVLRGIFSTTQIGRQLGIEISPEGQVQSFAEFEQLIAGPAASDIR